MYVCERDGMCGEGNVSSAKSDRGGQKLFWCVCVCVCVCV